MNRKGFTLVELLAALVIFGIISALTVVSISGLFRSGKEKSENIFIGTIKDAMEMYLDSKNDINEDITSWTKCANNIRKTYGYVDVYKATIKFDDVINSEFKPITQNDLVNPANKDVNCKNANLINVTIYKDDDFVYYYNINMNDFGCLNNSGVINNLPEGFEC